jgi:predicted ribosome quality control (RQC) complex YloA/Tae2 family protein
MTGKTGGMWLQHEGENIASLMGPCPPVLAPLPPWNPHDHPPRFTPSSQQTWLQAAQQWCEASAATQRTAARKNKLRTGLRGEIKRTRRLIENLNHDLNRADDIDAQRGRADLIGIHLHTIPKGAKSVLLADPMNPGREIQVSLNPKLSAVENMNQAYKKCTRLERMGDRVLKNLEKAEQRLNKLHAAELVLDEMPETALPEIEALLPRKQKHKRRVSPTSPHWDVWTGPAGQRIFVGRTDKGNRLLVSQKGKGDDIWMHVRGRPGPHVVIPIQKGKSPTLELLLIGAQIAILGIRSSAGNSHEVQYTRIRYVRLVSGDKHGRATVQREKVLQLRKDPDKLISWTRQR